MVDRRRDWPQRREWYLRWGKASNSERLGIIWREHRGLTAAILAALVAIGGWWFWSYVEAFGGWLHRYSETIRNLMLSAGVIGAGVGVWIAFRRSETDRLRQITDSFAKAVELLGHEDRSVRLGAIYALERIARQNRDEHWPIMETLTAYVREWSERKWLEVEESEDVENKRGLTPSGLAAASSDIQAVFTVLGRRRVDYEQVKRLRRLNLTRAYLVEAAPDALPDFIRAKLDRANLDSAQLDRAKLQDASLYAAKLRRASLKGADLSRAFLVGADLSWALLQQANFQGADLQGTKLHWADLSTAVGLTQEQLNSADGDKATKIPGCLKRPEGWLE